jgi:cell division protein FtsQ
MGARTRRGERPEPSAERARGDEPENADVRPSSRWKVVFVGLLVAGVLGTAAWILLGSRLLVTRKIEVTGEHLVSRDGVLAAARVRIGEPLARLNTGAVRDRVEGIQEVETARVERRWPATVRIVVRERTPVVVVQRDNRFLQIDRYGVTVITSVARPHGLPVLDVSSPTQTDPAMRAGLAVIGELPPWLSQRVVGLAARSAEDVTMQLAGGVSVAWGAPERASEKLTLLHGLLVQSPRRDVTVIDVSSPEVVTTRGSPGTG